MSGALTLLITIILILVLVLRELAGGLQAHRAQQTRRALNYAVGPLALLFFVGVVSRLAMVQTSTVAEGAPAAMPTASGVASMPAPTVAVASAPTPAPRVDTPTAPPTAGPQYTLFVDDTFAPSSQNWPTRANGTWRAAYVDGRYNLAIEGQNNLGISSELPDGDYRMSLDVTVEQGAAGVVFLSREPATFYRFVVNTGGMYAVQTINEASDAVTTITNWTAVDSAQAASPATYRLRVERNGDTISFFVNDKPLSTFAVPSGPSLNRYGFALTSNTNQGSATFDNLRVERAVVAT